MNRLKSFFSDDKEYFLNYKEKIDEHNSRTLYNGCIAYAIVLLFYTILTVIANDRQLMDMYFAFDAIHVVLCTALFVRSRQKDRKHKHIQIYCLLFEVSILSLFALEGAVYSRTAHSLYIPIAILLILMLFIHKPLYCAITVISYCGIFSLLAAINKVTPTKDIYITVATLISSIIAYILAAGMRHNEWRALAELERISNTDTLTGLYNKSAFEKRCMNYLTSSTAPSMLFIVDIDNFKQINDSYGHSIGDKVLSAFGAALKNSFRGTDIVGRFGGDEFVLLAIDCDDEGMVEKHIAKIAKEISIIQFDTCSVNVSFSTGVTHSHEGDSFDSILSRADKALYAAKGKGKCCYAIEP